MFDAFRRIIRVPFTFGDKNERLEWLCLINRMVKCVSRHVNGKRSAPRYLDRQINRGSFTLLFEQIKRFVTFFP